MPLILSSLAYDRRAIMVAAWAEYRSPTNRPGVRNRRSFGACLSYAWRVARNVRARMADGTVERDRLALEAREVFRVQLEASLTADQR